MNEYAKISNVNQGMTKNKRERGGAIKFELANEENDKKENPISLSQFELKRKRI